MRLTVEVDVPDAFVDALAEALTLRLRGSSLEPELIDKHGAAAFGLRPRELLDLVRRGQIAGYRVGRRVAVRRSDLLAWVESRRIPSRERGSEAEQAQLDPIQRGLASGQLRALRGGRS